MSQRVRRRDLAAFEGETPATPAHNATIEIFDPGDSGFDYDRLFALIADRISIVPRYRQRIVTVPGHLAAPVWVDDEQFDLGYHVRRSALPRPGSLDQLTDLLGRIISRPLDRQRPLWEAYFVEGLADGRVALLAKTHEALVDGVHTVDLGQILFDVTPEPRQLGPDTWTPHRAPSAQQLVRGAVQDSLTQPAVLWGTATTAGQRARRTVVGLTRKASDTAGLLTGRAAERGGPLSGPVSQQRRILTVETSLADYRRVRDTHGGTVNDVVLATVTGALRAWLMTRGESMGGLKYVRALVPVSVIDEELEATSLGSQIAPHFVDLPVGEPSPVVRLHQVSYSFQSHVETGRGVAANRLAGIAGFAPTTFHAIAARVAAEELPRGYQLCVTNVPGPQSPLYAAGARLVASYPVPPLVPDHALAVGVTSYDGRVLYGITADRDLVPDADTLAACVPEALDELLELSSGGRTRAPRGRPRDPRPAGGNGPAATRR